MLCTLTADLRMHSSGLCSLDLLLCTIQAYQFQEGHAPMLYPEMIAPGPLLSADLHPNLSISSTQNSMLVHLH